MFKKRLLELCNSSKKWIAMTVLMNWISIICNILVILFIGNTIDKLINSNLEINYLRDGLYTPISILIKVHIHISRRNTSSCQRNAP